MSNSTFFLAKGAAEDVDNALNQLRDRIGALDFDLQALNDDSEVQADPNTRVRIIALRTAAQTALHELSKFEKSINEFEEFCRHGDDNDQN